MATKHHHFDSHFQEILDNIDVKLITPLLTSSEVISFEDEVELEKKSKKQAVKFILRKLRNHGNGDSVFRNCLKTSQSEGHQKILLLVYKMNNSDSQEKGMLTFSS